MPRAAPPLRRACAPIRQSLTGLGRQLLPYGGPASPLGDWSRVWDASSSARTPGTLVNRWRDPSGPGSIEPPDCLGAFFVPWQQCRAPRREPRRQGAERRAGSAIGAPGEASPGCRFPGKGEPPAPSASERFSPQRRSKGGAGFPEQWYTVQGRWLIK